MAENLVTLVGALGNEPELRTTAQGVDVVNFRMATNERVRGSDGRWGDGPTSWFKITVWGGLARNAHASLHKGQRVVVHGPLRITEYATDSGQTTRTAEVKALAVGPDLTFGTTTFTRAAAQPAPQAPAPAAELPAPPVQADGGWSAPHAADDRVPF